jgi:hypothetical protein
MNPLGKYASYQDLARLEYGRLLWKNAAARARLLKHWTSEANPYRDRFADKKQLIERVLSSDGEYERLDQQLREAGHSLRAVVREIPPVFGSI